MDKAQTIHNFWSGFGLIAYDENTVPEDAQMPYITYQLSTGEIGDKVNLAASLWYRSTSWATITKKSDEIANYINDMHPPSIAMDTGRVWIVKSNPFAQRMIEESDPNVRRIRLSIDVEFLSE